MAQCTGAEIGRAETTTILSPNAGLNEQPNGGSFNEDVAFRKFNVAFVGLNGRHELISDRGYAEVHRLHAGSHLSAEPYPEPG